MDGRAAKGPGYQDGRGYLGRALERAARRLQAGEIDFDRAAAAAAALARLPALAGAPIGVRFRPALHSLNGQLLSGGSRGAAVHAGSFLRKRAIVLETELLACPRELARVVIHELFHFVWLRAGNPARRSWEQLLAAEFDRNAPGELGWSAEMRKRALRRADVAGRNGRWREYACESFCDSAAWLLAAGREHNECTLPPRHRSGRRRWLLAFLDRPAIPV